MKTTYVNYPGTIHGFFSLTRFLQQGIKANDEERVALLQAVKAKSFEKKDLLTADEFKAIADRVLQKTAARA